MLTATAALERRASGCPRPLALKPWNLKTRKPPKGREPLSGERDLGLPHGLDDPLGRPDEVPGLAQPRGLHDPGPAPEVGRHDPRLVGALLAGVRQGPLPLERPPGRPGPRGRRP